MAHVSLQTVEQLLASRSVWGTVECQLLLRRVTVVGIHLLLLWTFSPLGGQASLRALERVESSTRQTIALRYLYTGPYSASIHANRTKRQDAPNLFVTRLMASKEMMVSPLDEWGNVRIPAANLRDTWTSVPVAERPENFSSLVGIPVVGFPLSVEHLAIDFSMESSYLTLSCGAWETFREDDRERLARYKRWWEGVDPLRSDAGHGMRFPNKWTFFLDTDAPLAATKRNAFTEARNQSPRRIYFVSQRGRSAAAMADDLAAIKCDVREVHVEVNVRCQGGRHGCQATRTRKSLVDKRWSLSTPFDDPMHAANLVSVLPFVDGNGGTASSGVENFLREGTSSKPQSYSNPFVDLSRVAPREFSERLQLVVNTWYTLTLATDSGVFFGVNPANVSAYGFDFAQLPADGKVAQSVVEESCRLMCTRSTPATITHTVEVFAYNRLWLALLFTSAAVLLATGLVGAVIDARTHVPDMLGYVSSMTYNNRYLPLPNGGGGVLNAMERARILFDLPVSVSDIRGGDDVGRLAFTSHANVRMLENGRMYT
jgi:hypothetical protein